MTEQSAEIRMVQKFSMSTFNARQLQPEQLAPYPPWILGSGQALRLRQAAGNCDAPPREFRNPFATSRCLRFVAQVLERICMRHGDPLRICTEVFNGELYNSQPIFA